jgi:hypothetical protein
MTDVHYTPELARNRLLAAASAASAAITGIVEALRTERAVETALEEGLAWSDRDLILPLGEEVIEPLVDALRLAAHATGYPPPLHRIGLALDRFTQGDD